jgi:hypothetical protein
MELRTLYSEVGDQMPEALCGRAGGLWDPTSTYRHTYVVHPTTRRCYDTLSYKIYINSAI